MDANNGLLQAKGGFVDARAVVAATEQLYPLSPR